MLYTEKEKNEIERVRKVLDVYKRQDRDGVRLLQSIRL